MPSTWGGGKSGRGHMIVISDVHNLGIIVTEENMHALALWG